jgi:type IV secretory pathway VirB2 component (pilin)
MGEGLVIMLMIVLFCYIVFGAVYGFSTLENIKTIPQWILHTIISGPIYWIIMIICLIISCIYYTYNWASGR